MFIEELKKEYKRLIAIEKSMLKRRIALENAWSDFTAELERQRETAPFPMKKWKSCTTRTINSAACAISRATENMISGSCSILWRELSTTTNGGKRYEIYQ